MLTAELQVHGHGRAAHMEKRGRRSRMQTSRRISIQLLPGVPPHGSTCRAPSQMEALHVTFHRRHRIYALSPKVWQ